MSRKIPITESLRDYVERLHYEAVRYKDLLATVGRDCCPITDEEWDSSRSYFQDLCREAQESLRCAMDTLYELYGDQIGRGCWRVDFQECAIVLGDAPGPSGPAVRDGNAFPESYADQLYRLFPPEKITPMVINGERAKNITIQVTDACNMACTYCYQHNKGKHSMPFEVGRAFIDMILDAGERTGTYITSTKCDGAVIDFIGGEPWLEIDLIARLSDYFMGELFRRKHPWAIKFMFSVCSNGLMHFDPRVQAYIKRHRGHLSYNVSIDGSKELHDSCRIDLSGHGTYDRAIAAVDNYRAMGGRMGSKMTIAPGNVDQVGAAVAAMVERGYRHINLNCVYEEGWELCHASELYWQLHRVTDWLFSSGLEEEVTLSIFSRHCGHPLTERDDRNWCGGTGLMLAVDWKGDIYPCLRYMESSVGSRREPYVIGNIYDGIRRRAEHCQRVDCMACVTRRSQSTDECWSCPIAQGCGWCSAYNYEVFGTPDKRATYICCMHKARVLANVYYWRRRGYDFAMDCPEEWAVPIIGREEYERLKNMKGGEEHGPC